MRDHRFARRRMPDAIDGTLTPRQKARFARHVDECPECGPILRGIIRVRAALRTVAVGPGEPDTAASVVPGVLEALRRETGTRDDAPPGGSGGPHRP